MKREVSRSMLDKSGNVPIMASMSETVTITADAVRQHLLMRAKAYCEARSCSFSHIGEEAIKDSKFLARVQAGENFTVKTYQRVIDWLDHHEVAA